MRPATKYMLREWHLWRASNHLDKAMKSMRKSEIYGARPPLSVYDAFLHIIEWMHEDVIISGEGRKTIKAGP